MLIGNFAVLGVIGGSKNINRVTSFKLIEIDQHRAVSPRSKNLQTVIKYLKTLHIDVAHIQTEFSLAHIGIKAAKACQIPTVYTVHTLIWQQVDKIYKLPYVASIIAKYGYEIFWNQKLPDIKQLNNETWSAYTSRRLVLGTCLLVDHVVSPSGHLADKLKTWIPNLSISIVPNCAYFTESKLCPLPKTPTFIWLGLFNPQKRPVEFVQSINFVAKQTTKPFTVNMYGKGLLSRNVVLAKSCSQLNIHRPIERSAVSAALDLSSALVITSYNFDNQPMIIAEALQRGRGVVYCDPALKEGLSDGAGLLSGPDSQDIGSAILKLINNPKKLLEMSRKANSNADLFSPEKYLAKIIPVYNQFAVKSAIK